MKNLKKLLAIVVCIAMMVPTVAFAATSSPTKVNVKSATAKSLTYNAKSQTTTIQAIQQLSTQLTHSRATRLLLLQRHTMLRIRQPRLQLSMVTQFSREVLITRLLV